MVVCMSWNVCMHIEFMLFCTNAPFLLHPVRQIENGDASSCNYLQNSHICIRIYNDILVCTYIKYVLCN